MGSLMAGWSSPVVDAETALLKRNKSLTREEIDGFRRAHKPNKEEEEEESRSSLSSPRTPQPQEKEGGGLKKSFMGFPDTDDMDKLSKTGDWWTRSNWAFLNEPPRDDLNDSAHKYTAQFHVAKLAPKEQALH